MAKRWDVLAALINENGYRTGIEIGVKSGRNIDETLCLCPGFVWHAIDPWDFTPDYRHWPASHHHRHEIRFNAVMARWPGQVFKHKTTSSRVHHLFDDASVDIVFLDGDHSYSGVNQDINLYLPKVRPGGIISGHDYGNPDKANHVLAGVKKAVDALFPQGVNTAGDHVWWVKVPE